MLQHRLEEHGYKLLIAADATQALRIWEEHGVSIDLLLSDVVMPGGITGVALATELLSQRTGLKVILSSGYSAEIVGESYTATHDVTFLQKPYTGHELLSVLRRVLDAT